MSSTSGYGEAPQGADPEQPEWLRKAFDKAPSGGSPYGAPPYGQPDDARSNQDGQPSSPYGSNPYAGGDDASGDSGQYGGPAASAHPAPGAYPSPGAYPAPGQYPAPGAYPGPGQYPAPGFGPPGSPWAPVDPYAKSRLVAGLLGIFIGALGIHRFYLGYTGIGLTMLLVSVLSFGLLSPFIGLWGLIEGILYLTDKTGSYSRDASGRRLRD